MLDLSKKHILITGGTGTLGHSLLQAMVELPQHHQPMRVVILSRDEYKQHLLLKEFSNQKLHFLVECVLADINNFSLLLPHFRGINIIIHAAALKRVESGEKHAAAFTQTNINGTENVLSAAYSQGVDQVVTISTDKAVYPTTLYGATKLCSERLTLQRNIQDQFKCTVIRLGNIFGSRGSIVTELLTRPKQGAIEITHPDMTRFSMTTQDCAKYILGILLSMIGGEILVPKMKAYRLIDLVQAIVPQSKIKISKPRFTEKIHEILFSEEEARYGLERANDFVISINDRTRALYLEQPNTNETDQIKYSSDSANLIYPKDIAELISTLP